MIPYREQAWRILVDEGAYRTPAGVSHAPHGDDKMDFFWNAEIFVSDLL